MNRRPPNSTPCPYTTLFRSRRLTRGVVLVVADGRVGARAQVAVAAGRSVPVVELGRRALLVDVAEVEEEVRTPRRDPADDVGLALLAAGAVAGRREHERLACGRRRAGRHGEAAVVDGRRGDAVRELQRD